MNRSAFSLFELIIVLTIMISIVAIGWPALTKKIRSSEEQTFKQKIYETIENCRYKAIKFGKPIIITIKKKQINIIDIQDFDNNYDNFIFIAANGKIKYE